MVAIAVEVPLRVIISCLNKVMGDANIGYTNEDVILFTISMQRPGYSIKFFRERPRNRINHQLSNMHCVVRQEVSDFMGSLMSKF